MRSTISTASLFLALACPAGLFAQQKLEFKSLFNGRDLSGWTAQGNSKSSWSATDGKIVFDGGDRGWLMFDKPFENVFLKLEYRISKNGNSGVGLRAPREGDPAFEGMEVQIVDDDYYAKRNPPLRFHTTGSLYGVLDAEERGSKPAGEWNTMLILVRDNVLVVELNGVSTVATRLDELKNYDSSKFRGIKNSRGRIGLQGHSGRIEFRNLEYAEVPSMK